jgi:predicted DCC family thiol-disulfide oxidoreductase YuxK
MDYLWHPLEKLEFKAHHIAVLEDPTTTKMYFDGLCPLCTKEVAHYKNLAATDPNSRFRLVDINGRAGDQDGELAVVWGVTRQQALARIHVVEGDVLRTGVAGFVACWRALPYWKHLASKCMYFRGT